MVEEVAGHGDGSGLVPVETDELVVGGRTWRGLGGIATNGEDLGARVRREIPLRLARHGRALSHQHYAIGVRRGRTGAQRIRER